jgi:hypothetical protein
MLKLLYLLYDAVGIGDPIREDGLKILYVKHCDCNAYVFVRIGVGCWSRKAGVDVFWRCTFRAVM